MITDEEAEDSVHYLRDSARKAAQARAERIYVEAYLKVIKSRIQREHNSEAYNAREEFAYADPRYEEHLQAIKQAVETEAEYLFLREAAKAKYEAWRTQSSNIRAVTV